MDRPERGHGQPITGATRQKRSEIAHERDGLALISDRELNRTRHPLEVLRDRRRTSRRFPTIRRRPTGLHFWDARVNVTGFLSLQEEKVYGTRV